MKRWTLERRAGFFGSSMGSEKAYYRFRWMARLDRWAYLNLNLFPGRIEARLYRTPASVGTDPQGGDAKQGSVRSIGDAVPSEETADAQGARP
jgi:hypothetical protein